MRTTYLLLIFLLTTLMSGQMKPGVDDHGVYQNNELGFSFTPPGGMRNVTSQAADGSKDPNSIQLLLFQLSGPNSNDVNWRAFAVQSYARSQVSAANDFEAEVRMARTVIGNTANETEPSKKTTIGDRTYALCQYQRIHGVATEYSRVYTTMIRGQMIAFVFTANLTSNIDEMVKALNTLRIKAQ